MEKEKKEIGMEKLIELLNEFYKEEGDIFRAIQHNDRLKVFELENNDLVRDTAIISKQYGFTEWLVENDKIDIVKVYENLTNYEIEIRIRAVKELLENNEEDTIAYLKLLMLLAIQDEPIRFLCEIIK